MENVVIIGSGCAGLTAAIYAARANLKPLVLEGHEPGGQLSITTLVENFPGWPEGIQGPDLIEKMKLQATRFGADIQMGHLHSVDFSKRPLTLFLGKEAVGAEKKEVTGLRLRNTATQDESVLPVSAMFLGIGHIPNAAMFKGLIDLDA